MREDILAEIGTALQGQMVKEGDCDDTAFYLHFENGMSLIFETGWIRLFDGSDDQLEGEV